MSLDGILYFSAVKLVKSINEKYGLKTQNEWYIDDANGTQVPFRPLPLMQELHLWILYE